MSYQQQQQKQQYSKGNNFQIAQESTLYVKALQITDKKQIDKLYIEDAVKQYLNKLIAKKTIRKEDDGFYLTIEGKGTFFYKTQREINNQIAIMFKDQIIAQKKIFEKSLELYKNKNRTKTNIIQLRNNISINTQFTADCDKKTMALSAKSDEERKIYSNSLYKNAMLQSQYTMTLHAQNMNAMNVDIRMEKASQKTTERVLQHAKTMLETQKRQTELFAKRQEAKDWNARQLVNDLNNKYNDKANEVLRDQQQKTLDKQRQNFEDFIAKQKARSEREAANIRANADITKKQLSESSDKTSTKMGTVAANTAKVAANMDNAAKDLDKTTKDFDDKNAEVNAALDDLKDSVKDVTDALELAGDALDKFRKKLKEAGEEITNAIPPECLGSSLPSTCGGTHWIKNPIYKNATNRSTGQKGIKIFQCDATGHFCSSDKQSGSWSDVKRLYDVQGGP